MKKKNSLNPQGSETREPENSLTQGRNAKPYAHFHDVISYLVKQYIDVTDVGVQEWGEITV